MNKQRAHRALSILSLMVVMGSLSGSILFSRTCALASTPASASEVWNMVAASATPDAYLYDASWHLSGSISGTVVYDLNNQAMYSYQDQHLYDLDGMIIANVNVNGTVTDLSGTVMGYIMPAAPSQ